jgi:hypothetical protein
MTRHEDAVGNHLLSPVIISKNPGLLPVIGHTQAVWMSLNVRLRSTNERRILY